LVTSSVVIEELERIPEESRRKESLALVNALEKLDYTAEVAEIAAIYLQHKLCRLKPLATPIILRSPRFTTVICW
jgi:hypothetical protein